MSTSKFILAGLLLFASLPLFAQQRWNNIDRKEATGIDSITRMGFTLIVINKSPAFDSIVKGRMVETFFKVYPVQARRYNRATLKKVIFVIDPGYKGVAATHAGIVRYNPEWFVSHPGDIDVVTHEVMHIVQDYPNNAGPGWLTEGIADYVRYTLGVDNDGAAWKLPEFKTEQHYTNAYRVTARFLVWVEKHYRRNLVNQMDAALRSNAYSPGLWKKFSGKTVDELWAAYALAPVI